ncbi:cadherin-related family member 5 [Anolis sagrei]|uniref:cadherin-related family member 5 n=1 Tax=Anolis sagrei TaxID=38937 RepID=UPI00352298C2
MALFIQLCTCMVFVLVSVLHVQGQSAYCSVENASPSIEENNAPGVVVTNITTAAGVTVTIAPASDTNPEWFDIKDSQLILKYSVDYENTTVLIVELKCWSGGIEENSLIVVVTIINVNDNPPVFKETNIMVNVNEDTKVNAIVVPQADVTATDADADVIFYNLTGSPMALEYFNIQGVNNPQISLLKPLDYERMNLMEFTLYAMDGDADASDTHTATAAITIHILQADLRPPWFQPCTLFGGNIVCINYGYTGKVNVSQNVIGPLILEPGPLYAIDGDKDLNEIIVYEIVGGNDDNTFSIDRNTGNITMNKPVDKLKTFVLYIVASQENNPFRYSQTTVEIKVVHRNDHKPVFNTTYLGTMSVDLPVSSLVMEAGKPSVPLKIFARDDDFPDGINPDIKYEIQNSSDFRVTSDGFLLTTVVLDVPSTITLLVIANDTVAQQEASTLITIDVLPLATTTIPTTTTTTTTTTTATNTTSTTSFTTIPGIGTTTSRTSGPFSSLPPGINSTLPTVPSQSTVPTSSPASTTRNTGITESTGKPITAPGPGGPTPPTPPTSKSTTSSITSAAPGPGGPTSSIQPTSKSTTSSTTSAAPGSGGPIPSAQPTTKSTPSSTTSASPGPGGPTSSTQQTSKSTTSSTTSAAPGSGGPIPSAQPTTKSTTSSTTSASPGSGAPIPSPHPTTKSTTSSKTSVHPGPGGPTLSTRPTSKTTIASTTSAASELTNITLDKYNQDMAVLGGILGSLLAITLMLLGLISYKYYKLKNAPGEDDSSFTGGFTNEIYENGEQPNFDGKGDELPANVEVEHDSPGPSAPLEKSMKVSLASASSEAIENEAKNEDSEKEVKSILTKDRRVADDGYKSVWFKEDIDPDAKDDVLVIGDERNRIDSDDDSNEEEEEGGNGSGRGGTHVAIIPGRAQLPEDQSLLSGSFENKEENSIYL